MALKTLRWSEFLDAVTEATVEFENRWTSPSAVPFFRGHSSTIFELLPGLFRPCNRLYYSPYDEANLYYEFCLHSGPLLPTNGDSWNTIFTMQHHGLPTRILDWTESFGIALYFATANASSDIDVWFLDPYIYNRETCGIEEVLDVDADLKGNYFDFFIEPKTDISWKHAVAIYPSRRTPRMTGQNSLFTLHSDLEPMESTAAEGLIRFTLAATELGAARRYLKVAGINEFTLFPDLDGLARYLKNRFWPQNSRLLWTATR
jgi:hypothetical protein